MTARGNGAAPGDPQFICTACGNLYSLGEPRWCCGCGGLLDIFPSPRFDRGGIDPSLPGISRYSPFLSLPHPPSRGPRASERNGAADSLPLLTLGEGRTPLLPYSSPRLPSSACLFALHDHLNPSGSFKDRGAATLLSAVSRYGLEEIVEDSSGNAGAAVAAYAAAAGVGAKIFVPEKTGRGKIAQIEAYGAEVVKVPGSREDTAEAALKAAESSYYASHSWNPFFFQGTKTAAYEISEGLGWKSPDALVLPCGNGTLLLGTYLGWRELLEAGIVSRLPRLIAVQSAGCAPVFDSWRETAPAALGAPPEHGSADWAPAGEKPAAGRSAGGGADGTPPGYGFTPGAQPAGGTGKPAAEGIQVAAPVRLRQILEALTETGGSVYTVTDEEVQASCTEAWRKGVYIEPTAAAAIAGCKKYLDISGNNNELIATVFTGHGLKLQAAP
jgi:threonine synthase